MAASQYICGNNFCDLSHDPMHWIDFQSLRPENAFGFTSLGSLPGGTGFEALVHLGIKKIKKKFYGRNRVFGTSRNSVRQ